MLILYVYSMIYADFQQIWNYKTDPVKIVDFSGFQRPSRLRQTRIYNNWFYALMRMLWTWDRTVSCIFFLNIHTALVLRVGVVGASCWSKELESAALASIF